jgi:hypothetical protein
LSEAFLGWRRVFSSFLLRPVYVSRAFARKLSPSG